VPPFAGCRDADLCLPPAAICARERTHTDNGAAGAARGKRGLPVSLVSIPRPATHYARRGFSLRETRGTYGSVGVEEMRKCCRNTDSPSSLRCWRFAASVFFWVDAPARTRAIIRSPCSTVAGVLAGERSRSTLSLRRRRDPYLRLPAKAAGPPRRAHGDNIVGDRETARRWRRSAQVRRHEPPSCARSSMTSARPPSAATVHSRGAECAGHPDRARWAAARQDRRPAGEGAVVTL
jgi:hypothetical protein